MMTSLIHPNCGSLFFMQVITIQSFFKVVPLCLAHLALKVEHPCVYYNNMRWYYYLKKPDELGERLLIFVGVSYIVSPARVNEADVVYYR